MIHAIIVDDEYLVRNGLRETIDWAHYGIEIIGEADSGIQALELIQKKRVDLALIDVTMPGMTGLELLERIKEAAPLVLPVIVTCHAKFDYVQQAMRHGAIDYLVKTELEESALDENLSRISEKVQMILSQRRLVAQKNQTTEKCEKSILDTLQNKVWFLEREAFQQLTEECGALRTVTNLFQLQVAQAVDREMEIFRLPKNTLNGDHIEDVKTGMGLLFWLEQIRNKATLHFMKSGYREEIVLSVLSAVKYLAYHPQNVPNQVALCEKFSISRSYFSKVFQCLMGCSFQDYIIWVRIDTAQRLIRDNMVSPDDIAVHVGLEDQKYFNKIFQKATGMTPLAYQQHMLKAKETKGK